MSRTTYRVVESVTYGTCTTWTIEHVLATGLTRRKAERVAAAHGGTVQPDPAR